MCYAIPKLYHLFERVDIPEATFGATRKVLFKYALIVSALQIALGSDDMPSFIVNLGHGKLKYVSRRRARVDLVSTPRFTEYSTSSG